MSWKIALSDLDFGEAEENAALEVIHRRWLTMGEITQQFELEFAQLLSVRNAIAVTNATAGLHLACAASGIGVGDEVIVPSMTFVASANSVCYTGAKVRFADIYGENDLCVSPVSIESRINSHTKAIMVMHYAGYACNMPAILEIAHKNHLVVIEDAAHAAGASLAGKPLGTWGAFGVFSFFSNKNLATGEGGMIVTDDDDAAQRLRLMRSHGMTSLTLDRYRGHAFSYDVIELGYNYRIDEIRSAIGRVQLGKLMRNNARRRELSALYKLQIMENCPSIVIPFANHPGITSAHIQPIILPRGCDRIQFMQSMKEQGIQTSIHYPPVHRFSIYRNLDNHLPETEDAAAREVTLPLYPSMSDEDIRYITSAVQYAFERASVVVLDN
jgi:dTDP-4-amino-4,6-dideoxygalactose transaminase